MPAMVAGSIQKKAQARSFTTCSFLVMMGPVKKNTCLKVKLLHIYFFFPFISSSFLFMDVCVCLCMCTCVHASVCLLGS